MLVTIIMGKSLSFVIHLRLLRLRTRSSHYQLPVDVATKCLKQFVYIEFIYLHTLPQELVRISNNA